MARLQFLGLFIILMVCWSRQYVDGQGLYVISMCIYTAYMLSCTRATKGTSRFWGCGQFKHTLGIKRIIPCSIGYVLINRCIRYICVCVTRHTPAKSTPMWSTLMKSTLTKSTFAKSTSHEINSREINSCLLKWSGNCCHLLAAQSGLSVRSLDLYTSVSPSDWILCQIACMKWQ